MYSVNNIGRKLKMERIVNEEKRKKFIEYAGKRVNNVLHDIQILEPMARSSTYDFTRKDVEDMFNAMQETLNDAKEEFNRKFDEKARTNKKTFAFATTTTAEENVQNVVNTSANVQSIEENVSVNETIEEEVPETMDLDGIDIEEIEEEV